MNYFLNDLNFFNDTYRNRPLSRSFSEYLGIFPLPFSPSKSRVSMALIISIVKKKKRLIQQHSNNKQSIWAEQINYHCKGFVVKAIRCKNPHLSGILYGERLPLPWMSPLKCGLGS